MSEKTEIGNNEKNYTPLLDALCKFASVSAIGCIAISPVFVLLCRGFAFPKAFSTLLTFGAIWLGYGIEALYAFVFKIKRNNKRVYNYEHDETYFMGGHFMLPLVAILGAAFASSTLFGYCLRFLKNGNDLGAKYSAMPFLFFTVFAVLAGLGAVIWFYPFNRIISSKTVIPLVCAMFGEYIGLLVIVFAQTDILGDFFTVITTALIFFLIFAFFVLNQENILYNYVSSRACAVTDGSRLRNSVMTLGVFGIMLAVLILVMAVFTGCSVLIRTIIFDALYANRGSNARESRKVASTNLKEYDTYVFGGSDLLGGEGQSSKIFFVLFVVSVIAAFVIILIRARGLFPKLKAFFAELWSNIVAFLKNAFHFNFATADESYIIDYRDEVKKLDPTSIKEYNGERGAVSGRLYREFLSKLNAIPTSEGKLCFSYEMLVMLLRHRNYGISESDTPRQILKKMSRTPDNEFFEKGEGAARFSAVTDCFEQIRYRDIKAGKKEKSDVMLNGEILKSAVDASCNAIKRFMI